VGRDQHNQKGRAQTGWRLRYPAWVLARVLRALKRGIEFIMAWVLEIRNVISDTTRRFVLHPLIHTLLEFTLVQDAEEKKSGAKNSAFS
jgi:hypothetical protein